ncbi:MAG: mismatch repair protein MutS2 [Chloroflexi bacterium]|nr:mismatch repair protein MutS2 [Chloroflexota bacterium]
MIEKSLAMLEFPRVREILAGYTSFAVSREMALSLKPSTDAEKISGWLKQSAEARHLLSLEPDLSIGEVFDIREAIALAARGKILELQTLVDVKRTLTAMRLLRAKLNRMGEEAPLLSAVSSQIVTLPTLEKEIGRCISPSAELLDTASERLLELRRLLKEKRQQILGQLDSMIKARENEKYIQEPLITERDGRYVIPLKVELRREIKGIVHDISNTGATAFVEPMATVDLGNELREMVIEEQHEIERILASLSSGIGAEEANISCNLILMGEIDLALSKARFADRYRAVEPLICGTGPEGPGPQARVLRLINARHPLLKGKPVPLNVEIGREFNGLVITGPNTGGKTVALKTIGLMALMAQAGLPIPAAYESCLPVFDNIFADIGDEQSIEQTLSTFSWHMGNIVRIMKESSDKSLVLLDELGTATDPSEGAALAQSILQHFLICGAVVIATTHFSELKAFAHTTPGLQNASLDFDPVTLVPTYHLTVGIPGGSNALAIAAQLGLPESVITGAKERLAKGALEIEALLADLMREKQKLEEMQGAIREDREEAENLRRQLQQETQKFREQEQNLLKEVRSRLVREGDELQKEIRDAMNELKKNRSQEKIEQARKALATLREQLKGQSWQPAPVSPEEKVEKGLAMGDRVWLAGMSLEGTVISLPDSSGQVEVQVGSTRVKMAPENLEKAETQAQRQSANLSLKSSLPRRAVSMELDLRGKRADEVEVELDTYLNDASLANLPEVRIIHGLGTGTVRQIVRQFLATHPLVESFRSGKRGEGGDGATIVKL